MMTEILLSGFGGQGVLFAGKFLCCAGIVEGREVSWLPSYGPEMRGGTCHCSVIISDKIIGTPIVQQPDIFIAFNEPSLARFDPHIKPGGVMVADGSMMVSGVRSTRTDITAFYPSAAQLAADSGLSGLGNLVIIGKLLKEIALFQPETIKKAMQMAVPNTEKNETALLRLENNLKAIALGKTL